MHIEDVQIQNFRLLRDATVRLEERSTVIVGRNNSGKTSLTEIFRRLLQEGAPNFRLEDFSIGAHTAFWDSFLLKERGSGDEEILKTLPSIRVSITFAYDDSALLGPLGEFVIDLNEDCKKAIVEIRYAIDPAKLKNFFSEITTNPEFTEDQNKTLFFKSIRERIPKNYRASLFAVDPNDPTNIKQTEWSRFSTLLHSGFINAQRGLDDVTYKENAVLGKIFGVLFETALSSAAPPHEKTTAEILTGAVQDIQDSVDTKFNDQLQTLVPVFRLFGYPGLSNPNLRTETTFDVTRLLNNNTRVVYAGNNGVHLPESFNGLGARNLIYILLKLYEFFKVFKANPTMAGVHLIFIEEPEAHLHPQMQEVFIQKLTEIAQAFASSCDDGLDWPVQFIVTTHSSHMANRASFDAIRYFLAAPVNPGDTCCETRIKDFHHDLVGVSVDDQRFLHQYMTLTRCDLLFADKAILIEGTSERLLLPRIIEKLEAGKPPDQTLSNQYTSIMEVGGAYAHKFFDLLKFLELKTLIITDLDSAKKNGSKYKTEPVATATHTTNACIKTWFSEPAISPVDLLSKSSADKTKDKLRLAYQIPEAQGGECGRSFEEAFILANQTLFALTGSSAWEIAKEQKKSEFALKFAIDELEWNSPRYIIEGLEWLVSNEEQDQPESPVDAPSANAETILAAD